MNLFKEMILSIYDYKSYQEFLKNRKSKIFGFGLVLMLVYFMITMVIPFVKFEITTGGFASLIKEYVPDFELEDGYLQVEDVIEVDEGDTYLYIDTDPEYYFYDAEEMEEYLYGYSQVILMDSEKIIVKNDGDVQGLYYSELELDFSRDDLVDWVPYAYLIVVIFMIFAYIWETALFFFGVLFVALLGMIAASCMKQNLTFGQLYILGIYSRTLPLIIKAVVSFLPFEIPFFFIINFGISLAIIIGAIQKMKEQNLQKTLEFTSESGNNTNDFSWMQ